MFRVASIACGVAVALNAVVASRLYGEVMLHTGDAANLRLDDANYGSIPIIFGFALALGELSRGRLLRWATAALAVVLGVMTYGLLVLGSRGAEVALVAVIGLWGLRLLFARRPDLGLASRIGATLVIVGLGWIVAVGAGRGLLSTALGRWQDAAGAEARFERIDIFRDAVTAVASQPLSTMLGGGVGRNLDVLGGRSAHNQALDTLFDYGVLGLFAIGWLWLRFLGMRPFSARKERVEADSTVLPAVGLGICALWLSPIWFTFAWIEIAYLSACVASRVPCAGVRRVGTCTSVGS
jgi:O-antigen ligase